MVGGGEWEDGGNGSGRGRDASEEETAVVKGVDEGKSVGEGRDEAVGGWDGGAGHADGGRAAGGR